MDEPKLVRFKQLLQEQLPLLSERYQVRSLAIFGSYVRHEQHPDSDLDLLVTFSETPSLLKFISLENHLADLLGVKVDLVMPEALKPRIGQNIMQEMVSIHEH